VSEPWYLSRIALGYGLDDRGSRFRFPAGLGIFFTTASRTPLESTQSPVKWIPGTLSLWVKQPMRAADQSPPSSAKVRNAWSYTPTPQYVFVAWCLVKHRDNFTSYLTLRYLTDKILDMIILRRLFNGCSLKHSIVLKVLLVSGLRTFRPETCHLTSLLNIDITVRTL
jgi:hypothetical protein